MTDKVKNGVGVITPRLPGGHIGSLLPYTLRFECGSLCPPGLWFSGEARVPLWDEGPHTALQCSFRRRQRSAQLVQDQSKEKHLQHRVHATRELSARFELQCSPSSSLLHSHDEPLPVDKTCVAGLIYVCKSLSLSFSTAVLSVPTARAHARSRSLAS